MSRVAVVVGNPKPHSRTYLAAVRLADRISAELHRGTGPGLLTCSGGVLPSDSSAPFVVDLADLGAALLDWSDPDLLRIVEQVSSADLVIVASPTYKATYTGLLKLFLDRFSTNALRNTIAVPLMLGAGPGHALAPELGLRPLLVELGASVPTPALYVRDASYADPAAYDDWLERSLPLISALLQPTGDAAVPSRPTTARPNTGVSA